MVACRLQLYDYKHSLRVIFQVSESLREGRRIDRVRGKTDCFHL